MPSHAAARQTVIQAAVAWCRDLLVAPRSVPPATRWLGCAVAQAMCLQALPAMRLLGSAAEQAVSLLMPTVVRLSGSAAEQAMCYLLAPAKHLTGCAVGPRNGSPAPPAMHLLRCAVAPANRSLALPAKHSLGYAVGRGRGWQVQNVRSLRLTRAALWGLLQPRTWQRLEAVGVLRPAVARQTRLVNFAE